MNKHRVQLYNTMCSVVRNLQVCSKSTVGKTARFNDSHYMRCLLAPHDGKEGLVVGPVHEISNKPVITDVRAVLWADGTLHFPKGITWMSFADLEVFGIYATVFSVLGSNHTMYELWDGANRVRLFFHADAGSSCTIYPDGSVRFPAGYRFHPMYVRMRRTKKNHHEVLYKSLRAIRKYINAYSKVGALEPIMRGYPAYGWAESEKAKAAIDRLLALGATTETPTAEEINRIVQGLADVYYQQYSSYPNSTEDPHVFLAKLCKNGYEDLKQALELFETEDFVFSGKLSNEEILEKASQAYKDFMSRP